MELLLASGNKKKLAELVAMTAPLGITVRVPSDVGGLPEVIEDKDTFIGNAEKKASSGAQHSGLFCLADDSGLCVDALNGAPGVYSARYAGTHGDDEANNQKLLQELDGVPEEKRGAHFTCALALAAPNGEILLTIEDSTYGRIMHAPEGDGGFGYDPLFRFIEPEPGLEGRGFATLTPEEKSRVSHRGRALASFAEHLEEHPLESWTPT